MCVFAGCSIEGRSPALKMHFYHSVRCELSIFIVLVSSPKRELYARDDRRLKVGCCMLLHHHARSLPILVQHDNALCMSYCGIVNYRELQNVQGSKRWFIDAERNIFCSLGSPRDVRVCTNRITIETCFTYDVQIENGYFSYNGSL